MFTLNNETELIKYLKGKTRHEVSITINFLIHSLLSEKRKRNKPNGCQIYLIGDALYYTECCGFKLYMGQQSKMLCMIHKLFV